MSITLVRRLFQSDFFKRDSFRHERLGHRAHRPRIEGLEDRVVLTIDVWTGQAAALVHDASWSNPENWSQGTPQNGQDLIFPAGMNTIITTTGTFTWYPVGKTTNDLTGMTFNSIEIDAPGYTLDGNAISLSGPTAIATTYAESLPSSSTIDLNVNLAANGVSVKSGGTLVLNDVVTASGPLTLGGGGTLDVTGYDSSVNWTVGQSTTMAITSTYSATVGGAANPYGRLQNITAAPGSVDLSSSPTLSLTLGVPTAGSPSLNVGSSFQLIYGNVTGTFAGLPAGSTITEGKVVFSISYNQGVELQVIQSPGPAFPGNPIGTPTTPTVNPSPVLATNPVVNPTPVLPGPVTVVSSPTVGSVASPSSDVVGSTNATPSVDTGSTTTLVNMASVPLIVGAPTETSAVDSSIDPPKDDIRIGSPQAALPPSPVPSRFARRRSSTAGRFAHEHRKS